MGLTQAHRLPTGTLSSDGEAQIKHRGEHAERVGLLSAWHARGHAKNHAVGNHTKRTAHLHEWRMNIERGRGNWCSSRTTKQDRGLTCNSTPCDTPAFA
eukprot:9389101-Alexandrium_andersonii.AAC.1